MVHECTEREEIRQLQADKNELKLNVALLKAECSDIKADVKEMKKDRKSALVFAFLSAVGMLGAVLKIFWEELKSGRAN